MEENKYLCPDCGAEMVAVYEKPALNLTCPKCGCKIATTMWEDIDLDDTCYQISLKQIANPSIDYVKYISRMTGLNFINSKNLLEKGGLFYKGKAIGVKDKKMSLDTMGIPYEITPSFPY